MERKLTSIKFPAGLRFICYKIKKAGYECFLVGGPIRNILLDLPVNDWDLATNAPSTTITQLFDKVVPIGLKHGTLTVVRNKIHYEITFYKAPTIGRWGKSIEEDLAFRDFTINAIAYDPLDKNLVDPFEGQKDLRRKIIRAVGSPGDRFLEDPLRALRAIRFASGLEFKVHKDTLSEIPLFANKVKLLPAERVRNELIKILLSGRPSFGIEVMRKTGLLAATIPELLEGYLMRQEKRYHAYHVYKHSVLTVDFLPRDPILRLAGLLHDIGKPQARKRINGRTRFLGHEKLGEGIADAILRRLKFGNKERLRITHLVRNHMLNYQTKWRDAAVRRLSARLGEENIEDFFLLFEADKRASGRDGERRRLLAHLKKRIIGVKKRREPVKLAGLAISGNDVMSLLGVKPGKKVGEVLSELLEMVLEDPGKNTKENLGKEIKKIAARIGKDR